MVDHSKFVSGIETQVFPGHRSWAVEVSRAIPVGKWGRSCRRIWAFCRWLLCGLLGGRSESSSRLPDALLAHAGSGHVRHTSHLRMTMDTTVLAHTGPAHRPHVLVVVTSKLAGLAHTPHMYVFVISSKLTGSTNAQDMRTRSGSPASSQHTPLHACTHHRRHHHAHRHDAHHTHAR